MMTAVQIASRAAARRGTTEAATYSHFMSEVLPRRGPRRRSAMRHNLTTDTASGYTNRRDWQSKAMGSGPSFTFATASGAAAAAVTVTATSLTNTAATFPTAGQGLAGQFVCAYGLTNNAFVYGVIVANTATVLTIDQWYSITSTSGAAGTTPTLSGGSVTTGVAYIILPGQNPASWLAVTQGAASTAASTVLTGELTTADWARAVGTFAHTAAATTYTLVKTFTSTSTVTINNEAVFGAANVTAGGVMPFASAEPSPPTLVSGDTLQQTITVTIN